MMSAIAVVLLLVLACFCPSYGNAQTSEAVGGPQPSTVASMEADREVTRVVNGILNRGEGKVGDVKTHTWVPPTEADLQAIRALGTQAVEPLSVMVDSPRPFVQLLAVRLLKEVGGDGVVEPLRRALGSDRWVVVRTQALTSLTSSPPSLAIPIIRSAKADSDPRVSARAKDLLVSHYGLSDEQ